MLDFGILGKNIRNTALKLHFRNLTSTANGGAISPSTERIFIFI
jgi:hypothetical protein